MENKDEWVVTTDRYVGYIDIMGFKDLVQRSDHDDIYKIMKTINEKAQKTVKINWQGVGDDHVTVTNYSDSIIVYSKNDSAESCNALLATLAGLTTDLFLEGIPHRGAFAFGKMTLDTKNSIFFGQPLIDAYLLEAELNFYGVVGHFSAEKQIIKLIGKAPTCTEYAVPFKGTISNHLTIIPFFTGKYVQPKEHSDEYAKSYRAKYAAVKKSVNDLKLRTSGPLRNYVDKTIEYHKWLEENLD